MALVFLDNIVWHALAGTHQRHAIGTASAKRYAAGFPSLVGFADPAEADLAALTAFCEPGEHFYWLGPGSGGSLPPGWRIEVEATLQQFVWDAVPPEPDPAFAAVPLAAEHLPQMLALIELTKPGPFGPNSLQLGQYFGAFSEGQLVAMAGERMAALPLREISGVCTHPDFQGRGHARRLIEHLIRRELARSEIPFLHVLKENRQASRVYARMGFRLHRELPGRIVSREELAE